MSFKIFPDAITNEADKAAMSTFNPGVLSGRQITAATITDRNVIKKFSGRKSCIMVVSFFVKTC